MNVYQMWVESQAKNQDLWVVRNSWGNTVARIVEVGEFKGSAPYFGNPKVTADIYDDRGNLKSMSADLSCPGTYGYKQVSEPAWNSGYRGRRP